MREAGPNFLGIGAQKCATSWLHTVLGGHPDIFTSDPKELDFFTRLYDRGYEWYERRFQDGAGVQMRGETSPSYFYEPSAPNRVRAYREDMRIIAIFRDPVARAFSNHLHEIRKGHFTSSEAFEDGLLNNPLYVEQSLYARHMRSWLDAFPSEQILCLIFEEIVDRRQQSVDQVYEFLGVEPRSATYLLDAKQNESIAHKSDGLQHVLWSGGNVLRRIGLGQPLETFKKMGPVKRALNLNKRDLRAETPPMTDETRARLEEVFADDMAELARQLGRDSLPWRSWKAVYGSDAAA